MAQNTTLDTPWDTRLVTNSGQEKKLADYQGKVLIVVNTASKCGFTPQYKSLQKLYETYHDKGLEILGFPCDQFGNQEPGSDAEIQEFCKVNFGVTFPLFKKTDVNGPDAHPLFSYLRSKTGGLFGDKIKWNFTKFIIDRSGRIVRRAAPTEDPESFASEIENLLKQEV